VPVARTQTACTKHTNQVMSCWLLLLLLVIAGGCRGGPRVPALPLMTGNSTLMTARRPQANLGGKQQLAAYHC
jgi:hypothetical protein